MSEKENTAYIHNGILFKHNKKWYLVIPSKIDGSRKHYVK
jgi:hypothetical protein